MKKENSVKKDVFLALGSVVGFYLVLLLARFVDTQFGIPDAYNLVDIASLVLKVATASAIAWVLKRLVFAKTLGKDFGNTFDQGWAEMSKVEKTRWIVGTFLVIFYAVISASNG